MSMLKSNTLFILLIISFVHNALVIKKIQPSLLNNNTTNPIIKTENETSKKIN